MPKFSDFPRIFTWLCESWLGGAILAVSGDTDPHFLAAVYVVTTPPPCQVSLHRLPSEGGEIVTPS